MLINFSDYSANQRYHLMTQTIIPRPIAWVLTESKMQTETGNQEKVLNLAPFSYFTAVSSEPALLMLSIGKKPNGEFKDTIVNTLKSKKMVIHIASSQQADLVTATAASLKNNESELTALNKDKANLHTVPFEGFSLPRLDQCDIAYGCELYETKELGNTPQTLLFVEIKQLYLSSKVITVDENKRIKVDAGAVDPLARLGANEYASITAPFKVTRPS